VKELVKPIFLFPSTLGVVLAVLHRAIAGWKYANVLVWVLFLSLMAAVWVPVILLPALRRWSAPD
jgi:hypothetical protein